MVEASCNNMRCFLIRIYLKHSQSIKERVALPGWRVLEQIIYTIQLPGFRAAGDNPCRPWTDNHEPKFTSNYDRQFFKRMFTIALQPIIKYLMNVLVTKAISSHQTDHKLTTAHTSATGKAVFHSLRLLLNMESFELSSLKHQCSASLPDLAVNLQNGALYKLHSGVFSDWKSHCFLINTVRNGKGINICNLSILSMWHTSRAAEIFLMVHPSHFYEFVWKENCTRKLNSMTAIL